MYANMYQQNLLVSVSSLRRFSSVLISTRLVQSPSQAPSLLVSFWRRVLLLVLQVTSYWIASIVCLAEEKGYYPLAMGQYRREDSAEAVLEGLRIYSCIHRSFETKIPSTGEDPIYNFLAGWAGRSACSKVHERFLVC